MNTSFDKIYVISLITNKDRQKFIKTQLDELGLDFEFIYGIDYYKFRSVEWPNVYPGDSGNTNGMAGSFGCAIGHYAAVMQAYHLGYKNVLILEDDVCLRTDKDLLSDVLNNIPSDADFVTFDPRFGEIDEQNAMIDIINGSKGRYAKIDNVNGMFGGAMYGILNRDAMFKYMLNQQKQILSADNVIGFFRDPVVRRYVSRECLFVDQFTYNKWFISENKDFAFGYDNLYLRCGSYKKTDFFWPDKVKYNFFSRYK